MGTPQHWLLQSGHFHRQLGSPGPPPSGSSPPSLSPTPSNPASSCSRGICLGCRSDLIMSLSCLKPSKTPHPPPSLPMKPRLFAITQGAHIHLVRGWGPSSILSGHCPPSRPLLTNSELPEHCFAVLSHLHAQLCSSLCRKLTSYSSSTAPLLKTAALGEALPNTPLTPS